MAEKPLWLVLEDDENLVNTLKAVMEHLWHVESLLFNTGDEVITWIDQLQKGEYKGRVPVLALLDIRVPGVAQGTDVAFRLREVEKTRKMGICIVTGYTLEAEVRQEITRRAYPELLLYKPYPDLDQFKKMLDGIARKDDAAPAPAAPAEKPALHPIVKAHPAAAPTAEKPAEKAAEAAPVKESSTPASTPKPEPSAAPVKAADGHSTPAAPKTADGPAAPLPPGTPASAAPPASSSPPPDKATPSPAPGAPPDKEQKK